MVKKLSRPKIEAALKRAAKTAMTGPMSSRSGRVLASGPSKRVADILVEHVSSTAIKSMEYDPARRELIVTFVSDRTYVYEGVPIDVFVDFENAESKGAYFNRHVRDAFEFHEAR